MKSIFRFSFTVGLCLLLAACNNLSPENEVGKTDRVFTTDEGINYKVYKKYSVHGGMTYEPITYWMFNISYETYETPERNNSVNASTVLAVPVSKGNQPISRIENVIINCQQTIPGTDKASTNAMPLLLYLAPNAVVITCDYVGYGTSVSSTHPYIEAEFNAKTVINGAKACLDFVQKELNVPLVENFKTVTGGVSQGGAVALWVHKLLETEESSFGEKINFCGSYCSSGPFSMETVFRDWTAKEGDHYKQANYTYMTSLFVETLRQSDSELNSYSEEDFYSEKLWTYCHGKESTGQKPVFDLINLIKSKQDSKMVENELENYKNSSPDGKLRNRFDDYFSEKLLDQGPFRDKVLDVLARCSFYGKSYEEMDDTSWVDENTWCPKHPVHLFHGEADNIVPAECSEQIVRVFDALKEKGNNIEYTYKKYEGPQTGHVYACQQMWLDVAWQFQ